MRKTLVAPVKAHSCIFYPKRTDMDAGPQTVSENERGGVAPLRQLPTLPKWPKLTLENTLLDAPRHQAQQIKVLRLQATPGPAQRSAGGDPGSVRFYVRTTEVCVPLRPGILRAPQEK